MTTTITLTPAQEELADAMKERDLQRSVEALMKVCGWRYYHTYRSDRSVKGFPDIIAVRGNRVVVAELKTTKGRLSSDQKEWLSDFEGAGIEVHIWRPRDWHSGAIERVLRLDQERKAAA
jgi:hypothetical protein